MRRTLADAMSAAGEQHKPKKPTLRRFTWCRIHHALLDDTRLRLVARMSGAPQHLVEAFVVRLDVFASGNTPRGSVFGFNIAAMAAHWNLPGAEQLARALAALEHPDVGWIDQDYIVDFWDRNPDTEDATAAKRNREYRARQKAAKAGSVTRNDRNVTTISDQIIQKESELSEETGEEVRIVARRCSVTTIRAETMVRNWRKQLSGDQVALARILAATDLLGVTGGTFVDCVRQELSRHRALSRGPQLPLLPPRPTPSESSHG